MTRLRVAVDYDPALRAQDGIARYTRSLVDAMLAADESMELFLFGSTAVGMPVHPRVSPVVHGMSPRWWRVRLLLAHFAGIPVMRNLPSVDLFHATDFVFPPTCSSMPLVIVSLHDVTTVSNRTMHTLFHRIITGIFMTILKQSPHHILVPTEAGMVVSGDVLGIQRERMSVVPYGTWNYDWTD